MRIINTIRSLIGELNYARSVGITNDAGLSAYFRTEYKANPKGTPDYHIHTRDLGYLGK